MQIEVKPSPYLLHSIMLQDILKRGDKLTVDTETGELSVTKKIVNPKFYYISKNKTFPMPMNVNTAESVIFNLTMQDYRWGYLWSPLCPDNYYEINSTINYAQQVAKIMKEILAVC